ncbi:hypothetical protein DPEC_G00150360 [Dallia pectoralis]|uniref:Uncharacterized protein n=1 Tax=Dallia pectoralis TaxID=75939 RepID=A0ACC2GJ45_DALPE|nr:hypothetical protein DPEC_G00150360 [Dallia pectoralis]
MRKSGQCLVHRGRKELNPAVSGARAVTLHLDPYSEDNVFLKKSSVDVQKRKKWLRLNFLTSFPEEGQERPGQEAADSVESTAAPGVRGSLSLVHIGPIRRAHLAPLPQKNSVRTRGSVESCVPAFSAGDYRRRL